MALLPYGSPPPKWKAGTVANSITPSGGTGISVGIGTTSPGAKLEVKGSSTGNVLIGEYGGSSVYGAIGLANSLSTGNYNFASSASAPHLLINRPTGYNIFFAENNSVQMTLLQGGKVGLGTTSPNEQLEITGNLRLPATTSTTGIIKMGTARFIHGFGATNNTFIGPNAGNFTMSGIGYNTGVGSDTLSALTSGIINTAVGTSAGQLLTTGNENVFIGYGAGLQSTTGSYNTFIGSRSGYGIVTGSGNVSIGYQSGYGLTSGAQNVLIGYGVGAALTTGSQNVFIGLGAGFFSTTSTGNTFVGTDAGYSTTSGVANVAFGTESGSGNTTGNYNTYLGNFAGYQNTTGSGNIFLGYISGEGSISDSALLVAGSSSAPIINLYFGRGITNASASSGNYTINGTGGSGSNIAGGNVQLAGGKGTGNALGGSILFQTSDAGSSGSTLQSLTTKMTILASGNVGIGVSPSYKLDIADSVANGRGVNILQTATSGTNYGVTAITQGSGATLNIGGYFYSTGATSNYGVYLLQSAAANNYAIYSGGTAQSYFAGNVGVGQASPTAVLHLKAGTATANTAPLKFTSGTNLTSAEAGAMEFDGTSLFFSPSTTRRTVLLDTFTEALDMVFGTTTGTKIGTSTAQKLAFHNATPVVQRAGAAQAAAATTAATNTAPYGYTTAAQADAVITLLNEIRAALVEKGIIKGSA